jgi:hypothetical protein
MGLFLTKIRFENIKMKVLRKKRGVPSISFEFHFPVDEIFREMLYTADGM